MQLLGASRITIPIHDITQLVGSGKELNTQTAFFFLLKDVITLPNAQKPFTHRRYLFCTSTQTKPILAINHYLELYMTACVSKETVQCGPNMLCFILESGKVDISSHRPMHSLKRGNATKNIHIKENVNIQRLKNTTWDHLVSSYPALAFQQLKAPLLFQCL